jgi:hypothetical protein
MKGDWKRTDFSNSHNMKVTTGRQDGKFYITHEQENVKEIAARAKLYRDHAEQGIPDTFAPLMPDGTLGWRWIDLPRVCEKNICSRFFGNMPWAIIKKDRTKLSSTELFNKNSLHLYVTQVVSYQSQLKFLTRKNKDKRNSSRAV